MAPRYPQRGDGVPQWVLTMDWRGRKLAWTSQGRAVTGLDRFVVGSVEVDDVSDDIDLTGADIRKPIAVSLPWLEGEQPKDLQDRYCTLSLVPESGWDDRYILLDGRVVRTELDRAGALVGIEIAAESFSGQTWPPSSWAVTPATHPRTDNGYALSLIPAWFRPQAEAYGLVLTDGPRDEEYGKAYPVLYGHSADYDRFELLLDPFSTVEVRLYLPTSRCVVIDDSGTEDQPVAETILVAAGEIPADNVYVFSRYVHNGVTMMTNGGLVDDGDVYHGVDGLGQQYTAVDLHNFSTAARRGEWFAATVSNVSPSVSAGAGHIATWLLSKVNAVDLQWCGEATSRSEALTLGGYIDEPVEPLAWVQDNITGRLPIGTSRSPNGKLRLTWVPFTGGEAVASLTDGKRGVYRSDDVTETGNRDPIEIEIRYRYDLARERYREMLTLRNGPASESTTRETLELDNVHSTASASTAGQYALWRNRYRRDVRLDVAVDTWGWLRPGALIRYTDADLGVTNRLYLIEGIERTDRPFTSLRITPIQPDAL